MLNVKSGKISEAALLFDRYQLPIFNYFLSLNRNRMLADDLTQNVFEKMIKYSSSYNDQRKFKAWLFTIARNVNNDEYRKKVPSERSEEFCEIKSEANNAHELMEKSEKSQQLMAAINLLPDIEREIIVLTKLQKLKFSEVADIIGMNENTLKVKSHRCMKKLRSILINDIRYEY